jgi:predicted permease
MRRRDFEREMADELAAHIEHRADDLEAAGLSRDEARRRARLELGALETHKESIRDERVLGRTRRWLEQTGRDVRLAARRLAAAPLFAVFAMASIGVGAGVTTAVFAVVYATIWAPLGVREPETVAVVANQLQGAPAFERAMSRPDFDDYRRAQQSFAWLGAMTRFYQSFATDAGTVLAQGEGVSGDYFLSLGVTAAKGRLLQPADDAAGAASVAVLSDNFWRTKCAADPSIIGRVVRIGGVPVEIVGVVPRDFRGVFPQALKSTRLWVPSATLDRITTYQPAGRAGARERLTEIVAGRLKPGVAVDAANAEALQISQRLDAVAPVTNIVSTSHGLERRRAPRRWLVSLAEMSAGSSRVITAGSMLIGLIALVLAVACTNIANLTLARGAGRSQELAVRMALGASRARLVRELMAESLLIGAGGFALAVLISVPLMRLPSMDLPMFNGMSAQADPYLNGPVVWCAFAATALSLIVCGLWPALKLSRANVRTALAQGGPSGTPSWRSERRLLSAQVIVSVTFFSVAAVFISAISGETRHDPGVDLDHLTVAYAAFRLQTWDADRTRRAIDAVRSSDPVPYGFHAVAVTSSVPFGTTMQLSARVWPTGSDATTADQTLMAAATPGIFAVLGVPVIHGRAFDDRDDANAPPVAVVSESLARKLFGTGDAVGRVMQMRGSLNASDDKTIEARTIVGVTRDTDVGSLMNPRDFAFLFVPIAQRYEPPNFVIANRADGAAGAGPLRSLVRAADPDLALDAVGSGPVMLAGIWVGARIAAALALSLGLLSLILTMAGLFGVLSHLVLGRRREIGIRKALGADEQSIRRLIFTDGSRPVLIGAAIGLALGALGGFLVRAALPLRATPMQPVAMVIVLLAVTPATMAACYLPARRASRVDPNLTLKDL